MTSHHWGRTAFESDSQSAETARSTLGHKFNFQVPKMYPKNWLILQTSIIYYVLFFFEMFINARYVGYTPYLVAVANEVFIGIPD